MPDLAFNVLGAEPVSDALTPMVAFDLVISNRASTEHIRTVSLRCQVQIESVRRQYSDQEQRKLRDLFGEPERWGQTLRPLLWNNVEMSIPAFTGTAAVKLLLPCTLDLGVNTSKYFTGLQDGTVPVTFLFSGTVFYQSSSNQLQAAPISWNSESRFPFPVEVWKRSIDLHYPNSAWLCLRRDVFERLYDLKVENGFATFDEALEQIIDVARQVKIQ